MRRSMGRSWYESQLTMARDALLRASEAADAKQWQGECEDCVQIAYEVTRLLRDSLEGRRRKPGQLDISDCAYPDRV